MKRMLVFIVLLGCSAPPAPPAPKAPAPPTVMRPNMVGPYGPWLADQVLGDGPARYSLRTNQGLTVGQWRSLARRRLLECMAPVDLGGKPEVRVDKTTPYDGLDI